MAGALAHETTFQRGDGASSESFVTVGDVIAIQPPSMSRDSVETTPHNTSDRYRTFIPGLRDGGEVTLQLQYDPDDDGHGDLLDDFNDDVAHNYKIVLPTAIGETWSFTGFLTALGDETPLDDRMTRSITIKVSGKPTLAASS